MKLTYKYSNIRTAGVIKEFANLKELEPTSGQRCVVLAELLEKFLNFPYVYINDSDGYNSLYIELYRNGITEATRSRIINRCREINLPLYNAVNIRIQVNDLVKVFPDWKVYWRQRPNTRQWMAIVNFEEVLVALFGSENIRSVTVNHWLKEVEIYVSPDIASVVQDYLLERFGLVHTDRNNFISSIRLNYSL